MWSTMKFVAIIALLQFTFYWETSDAANLTVNNLLSNGKTVKVNCAGGDLTELVFKTINSGQQVPIPVPPDYSVEGFCPAVCTGVSSVGNAYLFKSVDGDQEKCKDECKVQVTDCGYARWNEETKFWQPIPLISK